MEMSNADICRALIYCKHSDGALCNMCPYGDRGNTCSKQLLDDASNRIKLLESLLKNKEVEVEMWKEKYNDA